MTMIKLLIAEDEALVRGGITMLLSSSPDIEVVGEAATGKQVLQMAAQLRPDLVLMDLRMPGLDGVAATRQLTAETHDADHLLKVLVLTTFNDDESVYSALRAGASGFLVKDSAPDQLEDAIRAVACGNSWIDPSVAGQVIRAFSSLPRLGSPTAGRITELTAREREVLTLMAQGLTNAEISEQFVLSEATVRTHVSRILMKTGSRDRAQAVVLAYQSRLVIIS
jgi:DNA-binding NarL/FixJ family response regulator